MFRFKLIAGLVSLVVLAGLVLSVVASAPVVADDEIVTEFDLVDNADFTADIAPGGVQEHGSGTIELDGGDLDDLEFEVTYEARDLEANTWYYLSVTVRETFVGISVPVAVVVVGMARTDGSGELEFEGEGVLPNVFDDFPITPGLVADAEWRIDQQVRKLGKTPTNQNECVECILVCAPTTKVVLNEDGDGLVPFGDADDDDDDDD